MRRLPRPITCGKEGEGGGWREGEIGEHVLRVKGDSLASHALNAAHPHPSCPFYLLQTLW